MDIAEEETRRLLTEAGAEKVRVEQYGGGEWLVAVADWGCAGTTSRKDRAFDTPQELAAHFVANRNVSHEVSPPDDGWLGDELLDEPGEGVQDEAATPELARAQEDGAAVSDVWQDISSDGGGIDDAEFVDTLPEAPPLYAEVAPDAPEPEAFAGSTILGADPLDRIRSQRIGDVARIAAAKIAERRAAAGYTLAEYQELQGYVMSHTDAVGAFQGDGVRYQRFVALADCQRAVNDLGAFRDGLTETLLTADREAVEAFDPAAGWPA